MNEYFVIFHSFFVVEFLNKCVYSYEMPCVKFVCIHDFAAAILKSIKKQQTNVTQRWQHCTGTQAPAFLLAPNANNNNQNKNITTSVRYEANALVAAAVASPLTNDHSNPYKRSCTSSFSTLYCSLSPSSFFPSQCFYFRTAH